MTGRNGFRSKPATVRFRLLAPELALLPGSDGDISLTASDLQALCHYSEFASRIHRVFITENEIIFLAFPPQPRSLVIFGAGYGFEALAQANWLTQIALAYWGDIDTHGFAILDQLSTCDWNRKESVMMICCPHCAVLMKVD